MTQDSMTELAVMLKIREDPKTPATMTTGIVIAPPPEPMIRLNDVVVLKKDKLVFASSLFLPGQILEKDNEVIMMPVGRNLYYVLDKVVKF